MENCNLTETILSKKIVCTVCGYEMQKIISFKCPRCQSFLFNKCSSCNKCALF